uniref:Uncharacterized protein n=1 Tax=Anopheles atroparvus TaxID=41427 RepID=A0AAG5DUG7_ANOAO
MMIILVFHSFGFLRYPWCCNYKSEHSNGERFSRSVKAYFGSRWNSKLWNKKKKTNTTLVEKLKS